MAVCAGCLSPIGKGEKFRLAGTEVFHERCVHRIANSNRVQLEKEIHRLSGELARERGSGGAARTRVHDLERDIVRLRREIAQDSDVERRLRNERDDAIAQRNAARTLAHSIEHEREAAVRERDAARAELALHRTLGPAPSHTAPIDADKKTDDRNPTEVRFSLIEPHES